MITVQTLMDALSKLPPSVRDKHVRVAIKVDMIDRGPSEGALLCQTLDVAGVAYGDSGIVVFIDTTVEQVQITMTGIPDGFRTGNPGIDLGGGDSSPGEEWKKG